MAKTEDDSIAAQIRLMIHQQPFAPFDIKTADGDTFHAFHPEFIIVSPKGKTAMMYEKDGHPRLLNLGMVVSVEATRPKKGLLGQGGGKR